MSLALEGKNLVIYIDTRVNKILSTNDDPMELFMFLGEIAGELSKLMNCLTKKEMEMYQEQYQGFYAFMNFFQDVSLTLAREMTSSSASTYH